MGKIYVFLLFYLALCSAAYAQGARDITGKVTDEDGSGLPGVNVLIEGTTNGTTTDATGGFKLSVPSNESVLVFSFIGYTTQKVTAGNSTVLNVPLAIDVKSLTEVVVLGYSTQKKTTLTGAVSSIDNKDIVRTKNENVLNSMTGKLPGVRIVQRNAQPGAYDTQIDIRGMGTPLFVVDGIVRDQAFFSRMSSEEIENVSVLKDGAAAVYGLRAGNGVVLVTTKKGTASSDGKVDISVNTSYSMQNFLYVPKSVDAVDYMTLRNESTRQNFNNVYFLAPVLPFSDAAMQPYIDGTQQSANWFDAVIDGSQPQNQTDLTLNGGNEKVKYFFNFGYGKQDGYFRSGDYYSNRWNMRGTIDAQITNRLSARISSGAIIVNTTRPFGADWTVLKQTWLLRPDAPFYANDNPDYPNGNSAVQYDGHNMIIQTDADYVGYNQDTNRKFNTTFQLDYDIPGVQGLSAKGLFDYGFNVPDYTNYRKSYTLYTYNPGTGVYAPNVRNVPSTIERLVDFQNSTNMQLGLHYNHSFFSDHNVGAFVIYEQRYNDEDGIQARRELKIQSEYLFAGETLNQLADQRTVRDQASNSLIGSLSYDFRTKYIADFKFRVDKSSKFPEGSRTGFFPYVGLGWRVSEEGFIKDNVPFLNALKLRGSYGETGNDSEAGNYPPTPGYSLDAGRFGWYYGGVFTGGVTAQPIPNPNLTWYTSKSYNAGIDFGLFQKLSGSFDIYKRDQTGILAQSTAVVPGTVGANLPQENLNSTRNFGYELLLKYNSTYKNINYYVSGQMSATRSMRTSWQETPAGNSSDYWRNRTSGRYNNIRFGTESETMLTSYQQIQDYTEVALGQGTLPGDWVNNDWNEDGVVNSGDDHPIGNNDRPLFNYGISLGAAWKGFDLALDFQGAAQVYVTYSEVLTEALPFGGNNTLEWFMDRWRPVDPTADYFNPATEWTPGYYPVTGHDGRRTGTNQVRDASYMRLKTAQIGYTLPKAWLSKIKMKNVRLYVSGYNLLTWTGLVDVDPERPGSSGGSSTNSIDVYSYPVNKTYTVGASIKF